MGHKKKKSAKPDYSEAKLKSDATEVKMPVAYPLLRPGQVAGPGSDDAPLALIVTHGMGQQIPFAEAEAAAQMLQRGAEAEGGTLLTKEARQVSLGGHTYPCVRVTLQRKPSTVEAGKPSTVDIYECYWAPLAEGQVTLAEVIDFLYDAGKNGVQFALSKFPFDRWMFGSMHRLMTRWQLSFWPFLAIVLGILAISWWLLVRSAQEPYLAAVVVLLVAVLYGLMTVVLPKTARYLIFALIVVVSLVAINGSIVALAAGISLQGSLGGTGGGAASGWASDVRRQTLTVDLLTGGVLMAVCFGGGIWLPFETWRRHRKRTRKLAAEAEKKDYSDGNRLPLRILVTIGMAALVGTALLMAVHSSTQLLEHPPLFLYAPFSWVLAVVKLGGSILQWMVWGLALLASRVIGNGWLLQYVGDVALYVSAHRLNRFHKARAEIRKVASEQFCALYGAVDRGKQAFLYREVIIAAHSLGSVVAYDAYNAAVNRDYLEEERWRVAERTRLMLTSGSPLDKVAFIFRVQGDADAGEKGRNDLREALTATVQPALVDYRNRPRYWVNIWSPDDWISGKLDFFDPPAEKNPSPHEDEYREKRVRNMQDPQAWVPLASHGMYGQNRSLPNVLFLAATVPDTCTLAEHLPKIGYDDTPPQYAFLRHKQYREREAVL